MLCETDSPVALVTGGCKAQARWVGPDGKVRCSLHQVQQFGHSEPLVKWEGYEVPAQAQESDEGENNGGSGTG